MSTKDVSDAQVVAACLEARAASTSSLEGLVGATGAPGKVCLRAMERAQRRGLIECGVSIARAWATEKGRALLSSPESSGASCPR